MKRLRQHHFTLVELIVAMAIFVIIMLVLATMLNDTIKLSRKRKSQADYYQKEQVLSSIFSRDMENMVASSNPQQLVSLTLFSSGMIFVTTSSIGIDQTVSRPSPLNVVSYEYDQDTKVLYRSIEPLAINYPLPPAWPTSKHMIAENVNSIRFAAFTEAGEIPINNETGTTLNELPIFIRLQVSFKDDYDSNKSIAGAEAKRSFQKHIFLRGGAE